MERQAKASSLQAATPGAAGGALPRPLRAARIIHPFPTLLNVAATAGLACVAAGGVPDSWLFARMLAFMLCAQAAIGVTNDYCDRALDAQTKPWKPIAAGLVSPRTAVWLALALLAPAAALAATFGPASFALAMLGTACGLAYDVHLKRTPLSALPFIVAIPVLPVWVWVTLGGWRAILWWILPLGALVGFALHLANTLPDIEGDTAHGVRGIAHHLGRTRSMFAGWGAFAGALAIALALAPAADYDLRVLAPAFAFATGCLAASVALYAVRRDGSALQAGFALLGVGSAVIAPAWLASVN